MPDTSKIAFHDPRWSEETCHRYIFFPESLKTAVAFVIGGGFFTASSWRSYLISFHNLSDFYYTTLRHLFRELDTRKGNGMFVGCRGSSKDRTFLFITLPWRYLWVCLQWSSLDVGRLVLPEGKFSARRNGPKKNFS